jgi:hypothetical protein
MITTTNDKGERVMVPDTGLDRIRLLWPATIQTVKESIKSNGVLRTIEAIKKFKISALDKGAILFVASGYRLTRKFD